MNATAPCLSVEGWRKGQSHLARTAFEASLEHETCYAGVDLASKIDLCVLSLVFPPTAGRARWPASSPGRRPSASRLRATGEVGTGERLRMREALWPAEPCEHAGEIAAFFAGDRREPGS